MLVTSAGPNRVARLWPLPNFWTPNDSDEANATATMLRVMTPEYASPEQIKGETDHYCQPCLFVGVLLYQILTGQSPYKLKRRTTDEITKSCL